MNKNRNTVKGKKYKWIRLTKWGIKCTFLLAQELKIVIKGNNRIKKKCTITVAICLPDEIQIA